MILSCGEALIDMVPGSSVEGDACFVPKMGGGAFNTAIALGRLGSDAGLFTGVSNDLFGKKLKKAIVASKVSSDYLVTRDVQSSLAFVELNDGQASYTFYTNNTADTSLISADIPKDLREIDALIFGGISLCAEPTASTMLALIQASANTCVTMIDPNIRPAFISDEAAYRARLHHMIQISDILKISDEDLDWLMPDIGGVVDQLSKLVPADKLVFITKGAEGADAYIGTKKIAHVAAQPIDVIDTIGAGDTFNAGLLHTFERHRVLTKAWMGNPDVKIVQEALELAAKAAAITVSRKGANPPWGHELT